ncbi:hypothetical protein L195_g064419, partial [Trifolium pratense]
GGACAWWSIEKRGGKPPPYDGWKGVAVTVAEVDKVTKEEEDVFNF